MGKLARSRDESEMLVTIHLSTAFLRRGSSGVAAAPLPLFPLSFFFFFLLFFFFLVVFFFTVAHRQCHRLLT